MDLTEAKLVVTTQREIDNDTNGGNWFYLSNYGDMGEFYNACDNNFPDERNPVYRYSAWEDIPDCLINKEWFCPNFFEIRDALEILDEPDVDYFLMWCNYHGHNIAEDDPHILLNHYQENQSSNNDEESILEDTSLYQNVTRNLYDMEMYEMEIFDENYA